MISMCYPIGSYELLLNFTRMVPYTWYRQQIPYHIEWSLTSHPTGSITVNFDDCIIHATHPFSSFLQNSFYLFTIHSHLNNEKVMIIILFKSSAGAIASDRIYNL